MTKEHTARPNAELLERLRISFIRKARLTHAGEEEDVFIVDLGLRGVFVERDEPLPVGDTSTIEFRVPGNDVPVRVACRVAWWHPPNAPLASRALPAGVGLEFVDLDPTTWRRIRDYVAEYYQRDVRARQFARQWPDDLP